MTSKQIAQLITTAAQFHDAGKLEEAEGLYRQAIAADASRADAICGLGLILNQQRRHEEAIRYLPAQFIWKSSSPMLLMALGSSMLALGRADGAVECARRAVALDSKSPQAGNLLGCALLAQGDTAAAVAALEEATARHPDFVEAVYNLGCAYLKHGAPADAVGAFDRAIAKHPGHAQAYFNRGYALRELGRLDEAVESFQRAIHLRPVYSEAMHNIGATLAEAGRVAEGIAQIRQALEVEPDNLHAYSALIYLMNFDPAYSAEQLAIEAACWHSRYASAVAPAQPVVFANDRAPERRLRIGYVSPDFRGHAESWFIKPLLAAHDRQQVEVHCYSSVRRPDAITATLRGLSDRWHDVRSLGNTQLVEKIRADGIDVLVDLTMHMEDHRLMMFARRAAPVQAAWLAYPGGTGLKAMDYRITDGQILPPDAVNRYPEKVLRLDGCWFCFQPSAEAPPVAVLPAASKGAPITFGSLNTFRKMSPPVMELWARTLAAVEAGGRRTALHLMCPEGSHRAALLAIFAGHGIGAEKIQLLSRLQYDQYLAAYNAIDIALDPFPHNGATTTCEALWMGVPVLTLAGKTEPGRLGASILHTVGLEGWIAQSEEEFIAKAVQFAGDSEGLARLREQMRERLRASPLLDAPAFARKIESAYRQAWRDWCGAS